MMEVENFTKTYHYNSRPAVDNITFKVCNGEIVGFAGLNGAGKTTTMEAMAGIILPSSGSVIIDGHDIVKDKVAASSGIGWMPEFPTFDPQSRPIPLLRYYAGFYAIKGKKANDLAYKLLHDVGLEEYTLKKVKTFSQGMKKRFSLASAMLSNPGNFLFDESLNGLDPEGIELIKKFMTTFKNEKKAVFLSSHILPELEILVDRLIIIHRGVIIETLTKDSIKTLGKPVIRIKLSGADEKVVRILSEFGKIMVNGDDITITDLKSGPSSAKYVNAELIKNGYLVSQFNVLGQSLEEHFSQLMNDNS